MHLTPAIVTLNKFLTEDSLEARKSHKIWIYCKPIYFLDIHEAEMFAKINRHN